MAKCSSYQNSLFFFLARNLNFTWLRLYFLYFDERFVVSLGHVTSEVHSFRCIKKVCLFHWKRSTETVFFVKKTFVIPLPCFSSPTAAPQNCKILCGTKFLPCRVESSVFGRNLSCPRVWERRATVWLIYIMSTLTQELLLATDHAQTLTCRLACVKRVSSCLLTDVASHAIPLGPHF